MDSQQLGLQQRHDLLQAVFEGTSDAVFVKDLQGRYLLINPAGAQFMAQSVENVLGRDDTAFWDAESAALLKQRDAAVVASGQVVTTEEPISIDGVTRTYSATKGPVRDGAGNVVGLMGVSRDITALKAVTEQLTERVKELRCLNEVSRLLNRAGDAVERALHEALSAIPPAWCYPERAAVCLRLGQTTYSTPNYRPTPARLSAPVGDFGELEVVYVDGHPDQFLKEESELIATLARLFADALQRGEASRRNRRFQSIIENSSDLTTILDRSRCVVYESPSVERMLGYAPHEVTGLDLLAMVHPDERAHVESELQRCIAEPGAVAELEFCCLARDGSGEC